MIRYLTVLVAAIVLCACGGADRPVLVEVPDCAITLTWIAPTERVDGSSFALDEIQLYTLERANLDGTTIISVEVSNPAILTWTFQNMPAGLMVFRINVTDTSGRVSDWSESVTKRFEAACS